MSYIVAEERFLLCQFLSFPGLPSIPISPTIDQIHYYIVFLSSQGLIAAVLACGHDPPPDECVQCRILRISEG
jgi:hypothetical protein